MMRPSSLTCTLAVLLCCCCETAFSQTGVRYVYPAAPGKELTMEKIFKGRSAYPQTRVYVWNEKGECVRYEPPKSPGKPRIFEKRGSLYCVEGQDTVAVACSEGRGISYGTTVSRNEFGITGGIFPSRDSSKIAFYRRDETAVSRFPLLDISTRTGSLRSIRYPMNGMASEKVSLRIWDRATRTTVEVRCTDFTEERYLTNVCWSNDGKYIYVQVLDRSQHEMHLNMYKASDGSLVRTLLTESNDAWVEPMDPLHFIDGTPYFIYRTDNRDGYRNLYLCDTLGGIRRLTEVNADVEYVVNDGKRVFYCSREVAPEERHLYSIEIKPSRKGGLDKVRIGTPRRLTFERGSHSILTSPDFKKFIDSWSSFDVPFRAVIRKTSDGSLVEDLYSAPDPLEGYNRCEVDYGTVRSADGLYDNAYRLLKPKDFDPAKKYPLILYVYGGPHSQMVRDTWLGQIRMWEMLMAQKGYLVYVQDNRGTSNHGSAYEKAINRRCGVAEMEDQMVGIRMLMEQPWVDKDRIGVHGWSYGGFMTISLMTHYPEVFKVGVAGGPVIDWKWYEVMYGERYMDTPETNPIGFDQTSLIRQVGNLKGRLLICQGAIDNTVVWQHSLSFVQACIEEDVQVDYFPYPRSEHNVFGRWRKHLHDKITQYFDEHL